MKYDQIIVGQGIAGTLLAYRLIMSGQNVTIIDNHYRSSSSMVAAGIVNPVTGRHYTKSWLIEKLIPEAESMYTKLGHDMGLPVIFKRNIIRTIHNAKGDNHWQDRLNESGYQHYISSNPDLGNWKDLMHTPYSFGEINGAMQLDLPGLLRAFRQKYSHVIIEEEFDYSQVRHFEGEVRYKGLTCRQLIFAEGYRVNWNPFFDFLPHQPVKGEALIIEMEGKPDVKILRDKMFITPFQAGSYWVGSGYDRNDLDLNVTTSERQRLEAFLHSVLKVPFYIRDHVAGIRPSVKDRKPLIGRHPKMSNIYLFNGFGTKGSSLVPYFTKEMVALLLDNIPVMNEVDIARWDIGKTNNRIDA